MFKVRKMVCLLKKSLMRPMALKYIYIFIFPHPPNIIDNGQFWISDTDVGRVPLEEISELKLKPFLIIF